MLSKYPISDSVTVYPEKGDHGSIYKLKSSVHGRKIAVYTAHLDYLNDTYYEVRGYDGNSWKEIPIPTSVDEVLRRNALSQRDEEIAAFLAEARKDLDEGYLMYDHHGLVVPWPQTVALEKAGFTDCFRAIYPNPITHPGITFPADNPLVPVKRLTWTPHGDERDRIDYLFCQGKGLKVVNCQLFGPSGSIAYGQRVKNYTADRFIEPLGVWPTDHKGVLATFRLE